MKTDALNRRSRFAKPQPYFKKLTISDIDIAILRELDRHGKLPVNYLHELTTHIRRDYSSLQQRLTQLYNGYCDHPDHHSKHPDGHVCKPLTLVTRNPSQWENFEARYQPAVYELTLHGLKTLGAEASRPFKRSNSFVHDLFLSCFTASVQKYANRFIFRDELLASPKCPPSTANITNPFRFDDIVPDDLFGLEYEGGGYRFFALEVDRSTESIVNHFSQASIDKKLRAYQNVLFNKDYRTRFGLPTLTVLFATTNEEHAKNMMKAVKELVDSAYHSKFLFKVFPDFGKRWRVPRSMLPVFDTWESVVGDVDICKR